MSRTIRVLGVGVVAAVCTFAGQWFNEPTHVCFTAECLKDFFSHLVPVVVSSFIALLTTSPLSPDTLSTKSLDFVLRQKGNQ